MLIKKILNNNVILTENESGREIVAMGRGIAFGRRVGDDVESGAVERIYTLSSKGMMERFQELIASLSIEYLQVSNEIIDYAQKTLESKLNEGIYIALTDHIHMAVHRNRNGIEIHNMMMMEIRKFYEQEFKIGLKAIEIMNRHFKTNLTDDEAGFIAMHIIDAQLDFKQPIASRIMQLIHEITNIVRMTFRIEFDKDSLAYYRLISHVKFFAKRVFSGQESAEEIEDEMNMMIKRKYPESFECAEKIAKLIAVKYKYKVSTDEKFYLTIHIAKVIGGDSRK